MNTGTMKRILPRVASAALFLLAAACAGESSTSTPTAGGQSPTSTPEPSPTAATPTMEPSNGTAATIDNFNLPNLQIEVGTTVTWTNQDGAPHTVTASDGDTFGSSSLSQGDNFSHTFDEPGRYDYFCAIHPSMTAVIVVSGGAAVTPTLPPPTPTLAPASTPTSTPATSTPTPTEPPSTPDPGAEQYSAEIRGFQHENQITIPAGTTVVWTNYDLTSHTVTAGTPGNPTDVFRSPLIGRDQTYSFTFDTPGEYQYYCEPHTNMRGTVIVE